MTALTPTNGKAFFAGFLAWVPVAILALGIAVSWGANNSKNTEQDRRIEQNEKAQEAIQELRESGGRIDERTIQIQREIQEIKTLIRNIQIPQPLPPR